MYRRIAEHCVRLLDESYATLWMNENTSFRTVPDLNRFSLMDEREFNVIEVFFSTRVVEGGYIFSVAERCSSSVSSPDGGSWEWTGFFASIFVPLS